MQKYNLYPAFPNEKIETTLFASKKNERAILPDYSP